MRYGECEALRVWDTNRCETLRMRDIESIRYCECQRHGRICSLQSTTGSTLYPGESNNNCNNLRLTLQFVLLIIPT